MGRLLRTYVMCGSEGAWQSRAEGGSLRGLIPSRIVGHQKKQGNLMTPRECFGIAIRTIGILLLFASVMYLYSALALLLFSGMPRNYPLVSYLGASAVVFIVGLYFLRGAPRLVRFAYPSANLSNDLDGSA